ncbi:MAG: NAD(P)H-hydrate dehydratase [Lachnospiraceae bacterium]|nr:NAD(P)H-hydrate dehydratase [Lachnospiraceae bacterium]
MITGVGTDLVEIARVQKAIGRSVFLERVYTEKERELIASRAVRAAGNFAAKEAVAKALGCGFAGIAPAEIEILRHSSGQPYVRLHGRAKEKAEAQGVSAIQISITDTAEYAQAYAICERNEAQTTEAAPPVFGKYRTTPDKRMQLKEVSVPVSDAAEMKEIDRFTIEQIGIPSLVLMERAALAVAECVKSHAVRNTRIGVLCGTGNNGGDGVAVARLLREAGYPADILRMDASACRGEQTDKGEDTTSGAKRELHGTPEFLQQIEIAKACGVPIKIPDDTKEYEIIVDALFGIGLSRPVDGGYAALIERLNTEEHTVIAVDIASGISASTGAVCGVALRADETVTFGAAKCGHLLYPGKEYTGNLRVADIGFPKAVLSGKTHRFYLTADEIDFILPERPAYSNKGTFGKVAVIAGSRNMAGAAYFAACAAYRTGAGLVRLVTPECNREILQILLPEAMLTTYADSTEFSQIVKETVQFADAVVIGPGLGQSEEAERLVSAVRDALSEMKNLAPASVWDADALNLLSKDMQKKGMVSQEERIAFLAEQLPERTVLTPHPGELSRLLGSAVKELTGNLPEVAERLSAQKKLTWVLKDAVTLVTNYEGCFINTTGNNGMSTGGSGDILCGVIAALCAGGLDCYTAATAGVWLHGAAGDAAEKKVGKASMIARDLLQAIGELFEEKGKEEIKW